jgi:hypothetical protein
MRKCCKRKIRPLRPPVTKTLLDDFGKEIHFSLMRAAQNCFTRLDFDKIGGCFNCIYGAMLAKPPKDPAILIVIEGAMRAMNDCGKRGTRTDVWKLTPLEQVAVQAGAEKAEAYLPYLDVRRLYDSMQTLRAEQMAEERMAA